MQKMKRPSDIASPGLEPVYYRYVDNRGKKTQKRYRSGPSINYRRPATVAGIWGKYRSGSLGDNLNNNYIHNNNNNNNNNVNNSAVLS